MAAADYRSCDVCGKKTFYDADLDYGNNPREFVRGTEYSLGYLGDWVVICRECSKKYKATIIEIAT